MTPEREPDAGLRIEVLRSLASACAYDCRKLAQELSISPRQLQRRFQKRFGCPPQSWLREERLRTARLMLGTASSVKEVAYALGFPQPSQFCRDFKARFGCTPSTWIGRV